MSRTANQPIPPTAEAGTTRHAAGHGDAFVTHQEIP